MVSPLTNLQLHLVQSLDDVLAMYEWAGEERDTPLAMDTESEGLQPITDRLRLIQLGDKNHGWAMPIEWAGAAVELMQKLFARRKHIVCHNSSFDVRVVKHSLGYQIPWHLVHDTMILAALADPTRPKGLKPLSARLIDPNATAGQTLLTDGMKANGWTWKTVPVDFPPYWAYAACDPCLTAFIWSSLSERVFRESPEAYDLERATTPILAGMMTAGLFLDRDYTVDKLAELRAYISSARQWLREAHEVTSLMSARQIASALELVGAPITGRTPTGLPQVGKDVLSFISKSDDFPQAARELAGTILKARHAEKIAGTYLENFLELATPDGAIHPSIQQLLARTGRMSCTDPNLQNLPRDDKVVRGCFIPRPGHALISIDASQIELRLAAHLCGDEALIAALREADETMSDVYSGIASSLFGETITKEDKRRQATKTAAYTKIYGGSVRKIAMSLGLPYDQAKQMNDLFDQRFPRLAAFSVELVNTAMAQRKQGEVPFTRTDTGRYLPCEPGREYALFNYVTQSTAAEALKRGLVNLASAGLGHMLRLPVHDEVILECPAKEADEVLLLASSVLHEHERFAVSIPWDGKVMRERWTKG